MRRVTDPHRASGGQSDGDAPGGVPGPGSAGEVIAPVEGALDGTVLHLRAPDGELITVERPCLPSAPAEFARAWAVVELHAGLGPRSSRGPDVRTLPRDEAITVRPAGTADLAAAAKAMHERCSSRTLARATTDRWTTWTGISTIC